MIISTNITRNKKPAQAAYQMVDPEPAVQNEPKVNSEVVLGDDEENTVEPAPVAPVEDQEPTPSTKEIEQTNTFEVGEDTTETTPVQEQPSEPEPQPVQEPEQPQEEHVEETPKKKASSKKK